jgi:two-component system, sensor histidine kinase YesM
VKKRPAKERPVRRNLFSSFRVQMLVNILGVLLLLVFSAAYILYSTIRIQEIVNTSFDRQRNIRDVQEELENFQKPFLEYLSSKSSKALSELLVRSQRIRSMIPSYRAIPVDDVSLREKEVYSLVSSWLDLSDRAVEEKRGMDIAQYTKLYSEMQTVYDYITAEIESITSSRFSAQYADYEVFIANSRNIQFWNLLFMIFISIFSLILIFHSVERINGPMALLSGTAAEISAGNFGVADVGMTDLYEIDQVIDAFNRMKKDVHTSIEELKWQRNVEQEYMKERVKNMKMEETVRRMELYTMQAQMNPHFLFNTLNTGIQLAIVEGADRTGEYMDHIAKLLRHNLREKDVVVPLRHEIEGLESYFYILGVRFPKNLDLILDCPADVLDAYVVPAYILQPLVENCVVHAFKAPATGEGEGGRNSIVVRVYVEEGRLCLSVADNGVGMGADRIASLLRHVPAGEMPAKVLGLENVIQRLYFFFPDDPSVVGIISAPGRGTEILVRIDTGKKLCTEC